MKVYQSMFVALVAISVIGDVSHFINTLGASPGSELSRNSYSIISGADAWVGFAVRALGRAVASRAARKSASGHTKNKRPSNKGKHQKGDRRRQKDQKNSDGQKGGKGGSKKRPNKGRRGR